MTEQEALNKAKEILQRDNERELTINDGKELLKLEPFIAGNKFGDLVSAFHAAVSFEVLKEFFYYKKGVNNMMLIDSPITPYSTKEEVEGWLKDLESMPNEKEVLEEIEKTKEIINNFSNRVRE